MDGNSGRMQLVAAVIIAVGFVAGGALVARGLSGVSTEVNRAATNLQEIKTALADAKNALQNVARAQPAPQRSVFLHALGTGTGCHPLRQMRDGLYAAFSSFARLRSRWRFRTRHSIRFALRW